MRLGRGEDDGGGRTRPAMLCASFEALIGALYLDVGVPAVETFMAPMLEIAADSILENRHDRDAKSILQEWAQSLGFAAPSYKIVAERGPDHEKTFEVEVVINNQAYGRGTGQSKQRASKIAARAALDKITQV